MIKPLVDSSVILADLQAKTKDAVLKELLAAAQEHGAFAKKSATALGKKLSEREALGSTGIGNGVAVPHVKSDDIKAPTLVVARSRSGIEWQAIDGRPVAILFLLTAPTSEAEGHLQCLRWISGLARNADFRRFFLDTDNAEGIRELLREMAPAE
jgi:fructose-specific phosphotransferase system IIA component